MAIISIQTTKMNEINRNSGKLNVRITFRRELTLEVELRN
jgi:hypothetical protein